VVKFKDIRKGQVYVHPRHDHCQVVIDKTPDKDTKPDEISTYFTGENHFGYFLDNYVQLR